MEMALNMGAFEELDQQEMMEVDGGSVCKDIANSLVGSAVTCVVSEVGILPAVFLGLTAALLYIIDLRVEQAK